MNYAIFLSGGTGSRIKTDIPKQYIKVNGHMMVTAALLPLINSSYVDEIFIVADPSWQDVIINDLEKNNIQTGKIKGFANPGENRQLSAYNGMKKIIEFFYGTEESEKKGNTVLIHDAARPFLTEDLLKQMYESLDGHDGVMPVIPMKDTVYVSEDKVSVSKLLDRSKIFAGQAPELFIFDKYYKANLSLMPDKILNINGASEPAILAGMDVCMIEGDENNFKVTTNADLERFTKIMEDCNNG